MVIYHYHPSTGEHIGQGNADPDPLQPGKFLLPAFATADVPPATGQHEVAVFGGVMWHVRPDYRGTYYDTATREPKAITAIGTSPDPAWTDQAPGDNEVWDSGAGAWVPDLAAVIAGRLIQLEAALHSYVDIYYNSGIQSSLMAIYIDPDTPAGILADIKLVWAWIRLSVLKYYYRCKGEIELLSDPAAVAAYEWDFTQFDANVPPVTLRAIEAALEG